MRSDLEPIGSILPRVLDATAKPCVVCGTPTFYRSAQKPACYPYGADGEIVKRCRWIHLGET